jgi:curli biogenesis system outer membrane secretion channel CsgG
MRKLALPLLIVAALSATSAMAATTTTTTPAKPTAVAATSPTTGVIKKLSTKACTVTLDNKTTYYFAAKCDFSKLKVGEKVSITWTAKGKKDMASAIAAATA